MKPATVLLLLSFSFGAQAGSVEFPAQMGGSFSVPAISLKEMRYRSTIRQQFDFSCGSAAIATLLAHHYQRPVTEQDVFESMYQHGDQDKIKREGFSLLDMKRYLETMGFDANAFEASLDMLAEARIPALALIQEQGYNHFVVIKGLRNGRVLIGDPAGGTRAMAQRAFETIWTNHILFVINNRQEIARFNQDSDWRAVPTAPTAQGIDRSGLAGVVLPKFGPADF